MKTLKIALGIAATAAGAFALNEVRKRKTTKSPELSASANQSSRSEETDQEERQEKPQDHFITDQITAARQNDLASNHYHGAAKNVQYHQRGVRHR